MSTCSIAILACCHSRKSRVVRNPWVSLNPRISLNLGIQRNPRISLHPGISLNPGIPRNRRIAENPGICSIHAGKVGYVSGNQGEYCMLRFRAFLLKRWKLCVLRIERNPWVSLNPRIYLNLGMQINVWISLLPRIPLNLVIQRNRWVPKNPGICNIQATN